MTLKTLCFLYKECNQDMSKCSILKSQYMHEKTDLTTEDLSLCDVVGLRLYLLCDTLAIYEYLGGSSKEFSQYSTITCCKDENDFYKALLENPLGSVNADEIYKLALSESIEPFKSRGIPCKEFNFAV
jgi:hypothetical protein